MPGKALKVNVSVANTRLFLGNIPKSKTKAEILEELKKHAGKKQPRPFRKHFFRVVLFCVEMIG